MHHSLCFNHRPTFISLPCEAREGTATQPPFWPKTTGLELRFIKISHCAAFWNICVTDVAKSSRARAGQPWWHLAALQHTQALCGVDTNLCRSEQTLSNPLSGATHPGAPLRAQGQPRNAPIQTDSQTRSTRPSTRCDAAHAEQSRPS